MKRFKLKNGLTVLHEPRKSDSVTFEVSVGTGSNNETQSIAGISHFLEHMMFEGTKTRSAKQISETIENVGGELNAATSNERTFFYMKVPKAKASLALEILSDMMLNPAFKESSLEKERKVVLEEIKMVDDQPMLYQWVLFVKSLFKKHPTRNPVYGRKDSVKSITRDQMVDYHNGWYVPANMTLSVVGDIKDIRKKVEKRFGKLKRSPTPKLRSIKEPRDKKATIKKEKRKINQAYMLLGFKTVQRKHEDSFVLDVISAIFSKGLSGRINDEIRVKRGLAYSVGTHHESKKDFGFIVFYLNCANRNLKLCKKIILDEIKKLENLDEKELKAAKEHLIGSNILDKEDSQKRADDIAFWQFIGDAKLADRYLAKIKRVSVKDIIKVRNRYMSKNHTMIVLSK
jgi:predicted Zn-dependent peptidase